MVPALESWMLGAPNRARNSMRRVAFVVPSRRTRHASAWQSPRRTTLERSAAFPISLRAKDNRRSGRDRALACPVRGKDAVHIFRHLRSIETVSYTHLTLPTSDLVQISV